MEAPQTPAEISQKLNCSLEDLIGHPPARRRVAHQASGRRIVKTSTHEEDGVRPRLRHNRSLDLAVKGIIKKREPVSFPAKLVPPGYFVAAPYPVAARPPAPRLTPQEAALLSTEITQRENGDVVVALKQTEVVVVKADSGDLILNSGGFRTFSTRAVINQALQPVNLKLEESLDAAGRPQSTETPDQAPTADWIVSDGRMYLQSYSDGMVVRQAGAFNKHQVLARGSVILQHLRQKKADVEMKYSKMAGGRGRGTRGGPRRGRAPSAREGVTVGENAMTE